MILLFAQTPPMQKGDITCAVRKVLTEKSFQSSSPYPVRKLATPSTKHEGVWGIKTKDRGIKYEVQYNLMFF